MENLCFQKHGIEVFILQPVKGQPLKGVNMVILREDESGSSALKICFGDIHQEIDTDLMIVEMIHIFVEEALVHPQGTNNFGPDIQLLLQFPDDGMLRGFAHADSSARQIKVGRALIMHGQDLIALQNDGADPVIEFMGADDNEVLSS